MFNSDDYLHANDWTIHLSEILMIHWRMTNDDGLTTVQITHKHGLRFLRYDNPKDLLAIERLKNVLQYPYQLPTD
jgi:hypothetical protein